MKIKEFDVAPSATALATLQAGNLLRCLSADIDFEDWIDGGEYYPVDEDHDNPYW